MNIIVRALIWKGCALLLILGLAAGCTRSLSIGPTLPGNPVIATNTPTGSYTPTPTNTGTNTNTPTNTSTPSNTPTNTATNTPTPIVFEDWEGPYANGNMWTNLASCPQNTWECNVWSPNSPVTSCYDATAADAHKGSHCLKQGIHWTIASDQAQIAPDSAYGGDYGLPLNIAASVPSSLDLWLKSDTANTQFAVYLQDTSGPTSSSPLHTAYYQNGTGSNVLLTIPNANTWTHFNIPLQPANMWSIDVATLNWTSILDVGTVFQGPASGTFPIDMTIYMDDYGFIP